MKETNDNESVEQAIEYGSNEWFLQRAKEKLIKVEDGLWDYSDSALFWTDDVVKEYEEAQKGEEDEYKKKVTDAETLYLKHVVSDIVSELPNEINYIDLGPGTENKQDVFLKEMIDGGKDIIYTPVDINKRILDVVEQHVSSFGLPIHKVHASFEDMEEKIGKENMPRFLSLGLTFLNFKVEDLLDIFKKVINKNGSIFINTQPREKVKDFDKLVEAYSGPHLMSIYNSKLKLIGLSVDENVGSIEVTDEVKVYFNVKNPTPEAESRGISSGDKLFLFQSMRYPLEELKSKLEKDFDCKYFDTDDEYVAVLMKNKGDIV
jgi:hypothetical protein